jgi:hypothetical protein
MVGGSESYKIQHSSLKITSNLFLPHIKLVKLNDF